MNTTYVQIMDDGHSESPLRIASAGLIGARASRGARVRAAALGQGSAMARVLFYVFIASGLAIAWLAVMQPRRLRRLGRHARTLGYAYVAAILIGSALRLLFGWGT